MAYSGGAPSAFACAHLMPDRIISLAILSGFGPYPFYTNKLVWRKLTWLNKLALSLPIRHPRFYSRIYSTIMPIAVRHLQNSSYERETKDRKSTRLNSSHSGESRMPSSA